MSSKVGVVADENGAVRRPGRDWRVVQEFNAAAQRVLDESAVSDLRNALQIVRGDVDEEARAAIERRLSSALSKLEPSPLASIPCSHDGFVAHTPPVGGRWDDHTNEPGHCPSCDTWFIRTTWATRREPDYTVMRPEQVTRIQSIEDRYAR